MVRLVLFLTFLPPLVSPSCSCSSPPVFDSSLVPGCSTLLIEHLSPNKTSLLEWGEDTCEESDRVEVREVTLPSGDVYKYMHCFDSSCPEGKDECECATYETYVSDYLPSASSNSSLSYVYSLVSTPSSSSSCGGVVSSLCLMQVSA